MIVAVSNQKGGVGKTTLTVHLAAYLAERGLQIVVVDADPQANATGWLLQEPSEESAMWEVLIARRPVEEVLKPAWWGVSLWPSSHQTGDAMITLTTLRRPFDTIAKALRELEARVENGILLIDYLEARVEAGVALKVAVIEAGAVRIRPIALTAGTVVIGAFVILFDPIFEGLAVSLIAGAIASTLLTLVVVPGIYYLMRAPAARRRPRGVPGESVDGAFR